MDGFLACAPNVTTDYARLEILQFRLASLLTIQTGDLTRMSSTAGFSLLVIIPVSFSVLLDAQVQLACCASC